MTKEEVIKYIPHRGHMVLIDSIQNSSLEDFRVEVKITENSLLYHETGVPSYCAIEYMAQSIAAFNTFHFTEEKRSKLGFIVAIRNFSTTTTQFKNREILDVRVEPILIVKNSGSFICKIYSKESEIASARITAYVPTIEELEKLKRDSYE